MRKKLYLAALTAALSLGTAATAYAAQWVPDSSGWWYQEDGGSWPASTWKWIDGNQDGVAECYYFDENGYLVTNGTTPDGYQVNGDGAWTVDGQIQTQEQGTSVQTKTAAYGDYQINPQIFEEMTMTARQVLERYGHHYTWIDGSQMDLNADGRTFLISNYSNAEELFLDDPTFERYYAYVRLVPGHEENEYDAAYDLNHDNVIDTKDTDAALNTGNRELYLKILNYYSDTYSIDWERPICRIYTNGNVLKGAFGDSCPVEEVARVVKKMGATNVEVTNKTWQEEIMARDPNAPSGQLFGTIHTGQYRDVNRTALEFNLNGLHFYVGGSNGNIVSSSSWTIDQAAEPARE